MTKIDLIDGELDFHERMKQLGELFCRIVYSKLADGKEPSNIANLLADYAEHSQHCSDRQATKVQANRKSVVSGTRVSVRVNLGGRRILQKKHLQTPTQTINIRDTLPN